jgi:hypothetical protein
MSIPEMLIFTPLISMTERYYGNLNMRISRINNG